MQVKDRALGGLTAVSLNFDSLGEAYGFPNNFKDPTFTAVAERFFALAERFSFKYSIFVVGKDLEREENRNAVREWATRGHEIGNHSWSHPINLGAMPQAEIREEIGRAHDAIARATGVAPRGFIAPGWSTSRELLRVLIDLGYEYDTSSAPSWLMVPSLLKATLNHLGQRKAFRFLDRRDFAVFLAGPRQAHFTRGDLLAVEDPDPSAKGRILSLPLPTNRYRVACWHTLGFVLGWRMHRRLLESCLRDVDAFYYLMHPADLMARTDLDPSRRSGFEREDVSLEKKLELAEAAIRIIVESGRKIVTMSELARTHSARLLQPHTPPAPARA